VIYLRGRLPSALANRLRMDSPLSEIFKLDPDVKTEFT